MAADTEIVLADVLNDLIAGKDLDDRTTEAVMAQIMQGDVPPAWIAGFLVALRSKGESAQEVAGLVRTMRRFALVVDSGGPVVDTCGTGGDRAGTFNVSTVAALIAAGAGARVAKHGNRAASGRCGSADLLEAWGVVIDLPPAGVEACLAEVGIGFCFAPGFHPATRHVMPVRRELGVPTVFNYLGPLTNPAGAAHQTIGVSDRQVAGRMAEVLARLESTHALVFHGDDGLDELTTTGPSQIWEVRGDQMRTWRFDPADVGLPRADVADLRGGEIGDNRRMAEQVLEGRPGPARDISLLGAAAALYAADMADSIGEGLEAARAAVDDGAAQDVLDRWIRVSRKQVAVRS